MRSRKKSISVSRFTLELSCEGLRAKAQSPRAGPGPGPVASPGPSAMALGRWACILHVDTRRCAVRQHVAVGARAVLRACDVRLGADAIGVVRRAARDRAVGEPV